MAGTVITKKGKKLLAQLLSATGTLHFSRIAVGVGNGENIANPEDITELQNYKMDAVISKCEAGEDTANITFQLISSRVETGFLATEIGVYAKLGKTQDSEEVLYAYMDITDDPQYIYAQDDNVQKFVEITLSVVIANTQEVTANVSQDSIIFREEYEKLENKVSELETPEFVESENRDNIESGDKLGVIFGKIRKNISELSNVDNTSDMDKPVSTAQQQALDMQYHQLTGYTDGKIADLIGGAPETLDTLKEIADAIEEHEGVVDALDAAVGKKANKTELDTHTGNSIVHITSAERAKWDEVENKVDKVAGKGLSENDFTDADKTELAALREDVTEINSKLSHVGMIVHSTKLDTEAKVIAIYGGIKWTKIEGRFLLGQSTVYGINSIGGEAAHVLSVNEIPSHTHRPVGWVRGITTDGTYSHYALGRLGTPGAVDNWGQYVESTGGNGAHNNMPPYKTVYIWERTA